MKIICISGKAQNGKDTVGEMLYTILDGLGYKVLTTHQADLVKYICKQFFDWNGDKDEAGRTLLQRVGTDVVRAQRPNYWVDFLRGIFTMFPNEWDYAIIPDTRFPNEIDAFKQDGLDVMHIRIVRPNFESPLTEEQQRHPSETALDNVKPDVILKNDGTQSDLWNKVAACLPKILADNK